MLQFFSPEVNAKRPKKMATPRWRGPDLPDFDYMDRVGRF